MSATDSSFEIHEHTEMKKKIPWCASQIEAEGFKSMTLVAEGKAVNKLISIAEILKRGHPFLVQSSDLLPSSDHPEEPLLRITLSKP